MGALFYSQALDHVVPVSSASVAEMVKLLENTFSMINIGLVNEMAMMCERMGINVWDVIDAAATKPFGYIPCAPLFLGAERTHRVGEQILGVESPGFLRDQGAAILHSDAD